MGQLVPQHLMLEACKLANLLAHVSQLCQKLNLPTPMELYRPTFFMHLSGYHADTPITIKAEAIP